MGFTIVPRMSITWSQALAWVRQRQLLEPVGRESVADVVRRLGAVLAVDDSAAELAVRMRRAHSRAGEVVRALEDGRLIQAFALRGAMPYLSPEDGGAHLALRSAGRQWEQPSWQEYYELGAGDWPAFRETVRQALANGPLTVARAGCGGDAHGGIPAPATRLRRRRGHADQALDLAGRHELRSTPERAAHLPATRRERALGGGVGSRRCGAARVGRALPCLRASDRGRFTTGSATGAALPTCSGSGRAISSTNSAPTKTPAGDDPGAPGPIGGATDDRTEHEPGDAVAL